MTLAQIAVECGFHDQPHFTRSSSRNGPALLLNRLAVEPAPVTPKWINPRES